MKNISRINYILLAFLLSIFIFMGGCKCGGCIGCGTLNYNFYDIRYESVNSDPNDSNYTSNYILIYQNRVAPCFYKPYIKLVCKDGITRNAFYQSHYISEITIDEQLVECVNINFKATYSKGCRPRTTNIIYDYSSTTICYVPSLDIFYKGGYKLVPTPYR